MSNAKKKVKVFDGRYEILSIVGRGSASVVYHARHLSNPDQQVALKVLVSKNQLMPRSDLLRKEALAMVSARHQYVIRLDDFYSVGELCYLAMEFAPYGDLRRYIQGTGGALLIPQAKTFLTQSAEALGFIHDAGILHRDIKPDNILVMSPKGIRLGDFGVALLPGEESSLSELQRGVGTLNYMAPEVLEGVRYDKRSDLYALGVSFYELLSGVHPFENASLIDQIKIRKDGNFAELSSLVPEIPASLNTAIMELLRFDPDKRIPDAGVLKDILSSRGQTRAANSTAPSSQPTDTTRTSATFDKMRTIHESRPEAESRFEAQNVTKPQAHNKDDALLEKNPGSAAPSTSAGQGAAIQQERERKHTERTPLLAGMRQAKAKATSEKSSSATKKNTQTSSSQRVKQTEPSLESTAVLSAEEARNLASAALSSSASSTQGSNKHKNSTDSSNKAPSLIEKSHRKTTTTLPARQNEKVRKEQSEKGASTQIRQERDPAYDGRKKLSKRQLLRRAPLLSMMAITVILIGVLLSTKPQQKQPLTNADLHEVTLEERLTLNPLLAPQGSVPSNAITFPDLPIGTYAGRVQGLFGRDSIPMLVIARADIITLILGEPGLTPATTERSSVITEPPALRFALDGLVLQFTGVVFDEGVIGGTVINLVSDESGAFQLTPATIGLSQGEHVEESATDESDLILEGSQNDTTDKATIDIQNSAGIETNANQTDNLSALTDSAHKPEQTDIEKSDSTNSDLRQPIAFNAQPFVNVAELHLSQEFSPTSSEYMTELHNVSKLQEEALLNNMTKGRKL